MRPATPIIFVPGRGPAVRPVGYRPMSAYMTAAPPDAPAAPFDLTDGLSGWQMLGNGPDPTLTGPEAKYAATGVGDCGIVMTVNQTYADNWLTKRAASDGGHWEYPSADTAVGWYFFYDKGQDVGVVNSQLFAYWRTHPLPWANKLVGNGGINYQDWDEAYAYVCAFNGAALGITVTQTMMDQTNAGEPWDLTGSPDDDDILGGHDVYVLPSQPEAGMGEVVTWGMRQQFTQRWWLSEVEECDALLTAAQVAAKGNGLGVDLDKLDAYMARLS